MRGPQIGTSEAMWTDCLCKVTRRGLLGIKLASLMPMKASRPHSPRFCARRGRGAPDTRPRELSIPYASDLPPQSPNSDMLSKIHSRSDATRVYTPNVFPHSSPFDTIPTKMAFSGLLPLVRGPPLSPWQVWVPPQALPAHIIPGRIPLYESLHVWLSTYGTEAFRSWSDSSPSNDISPQPATVSFSPIAICVLGVARGMTVAGSVLCTRSSATSCSNVFGSNFLWTINLSTSD